MQRSSFRLALIVLAFMLVLSGTRLPSSHAAQRTPAPTAPDARARVADAYGQLPMHFEANQGQFDDRVDFLTRGSGYTLFLTGTEAVFSLRAPVESTPARGFLPAPDDLEADHPAAQTTVLRMQLVGGNPHPQVSGAERLPGIINYFIGNDPDQWVTDIPTYGAVDYLDVYPGINLRYYGNQTGLQYDFIVQPGADPSIIRLQFQDAESVELDTNGDLLLGLPGGVLRQHAPFTYQDLNGEQVEVSSRFVLLEGGQVGFAVDTYNRSRPLVIDPELIYSTYLGGSAGDSGYGIAVDSSGAAYITGNTGSTDFPTHNPYQASHAGGITDAFVTRLAPDGSALVYSTYLGGSDSDCGYGIAVDSSGAAYITGETSSSDFPTQNPYQAALQGGEDVFVTKLAPDGSALVYSTYLGGSSSDRGYGIAVDSSGAAYVTGYTVSTNFPTQNPYQADQGGYDAFVTKLNTSGSALVYSTYLGGGSDDYGRSIEVDSSGAAYVTGYTLSTNFPTQNPYQAANQGGYDAFVAKLNASGSSLAYSTYLGGGSGDLGYGIAVDSSGAAYITGRTDSTGFPTQNPYQATNQGGYDAFVTKLNTSGSALVYSTYLGGSGNDFGYGIALDSSGAAYVTGYTVSTNFPTQNPYQATNQGGYDAFVTRLAPDGSALAYSTYLGGSSSDYGYGIAVDSSSAAYVTGHTYSTDFPTQDPYQAANQGGSDAFVTRLASYVVTNTNDSGASSLRQAILDANTAPGDDLIVFGVSGTITLSSALPSITSTITLDGTGQTIAIDGNDSVRVFEVTSTGALAINNITIQQGNADAGGGIYSSGTLEVTACTFSDNTANWGGGGIYINGGTTAVATSTFVDNTANYGSGIANLATLDVTTSTFSGNANGNGGSIYNYDTLTVTASTFSDNTAGSGGAALDNFDTVYLAGNIFQQGTSGANCANNGGTLTDNGYNLSSDGTCTNGGSGSATNVTLDLDPLATNDGGSTQTHLPGAGSEAISAIPNGTVVDNNGVTLACDGTTTDQNGISRPRDVGGVGDCTSGAVEVVDTIAPSVPVLLSPAHQGVTNDSTPLFDWQDSSGSPFRYQLQVDNNGDFSSPVFTANTILSQRVSLAALTDGGYFWHVRARDAIGNWSAWSTRWFFRVDTHAPSRPVLQTPAHLSTTNDATPFFNWQDSTGQPTLYQIQIDNNGDFSSPVRTANRTVSNYTMPTSLGNGLYFWHVRARDAAGNWSAWSARWWVRVDTVPPSRPVLQVPAQGAVLSDTTPFFDWQDSTGAPTLYQIQIDNNGDFSSPVRTANRTVSNYTMPTPLSNGLYFWHVRVRDAAGNWSIWSVRRSFIISHSAAGSIQINEVQIAGPDAVELLNTTGEAYDLSGWQVLNYDERGRLYASYTFPDGFTLAPHAYVTVHESSGTDTPSDLYTGANLWWEPEAGAVALVDGTIGVDFVRWGGSLVEPTASGNAWTGSNPLGPRFSQTLGRALNSVDSDRGQDWCRQAPSFGTQNGGCLEPAAIPDGVPADGCFEEVHPLWTLHGNWQPRSSDTASSGEYLVYTFGQTNPDAYAEFRFAGEGFALVYHKSPFGGFANVYVDDLRVPYAQLDMYAVSETWLREAVFTVSGLDPTVEHVLRIAPAGQKNVRSRGYAIYVDRVDVPVLNAYREDGCFFIREEDMPQ